MSFGSSCGGGQRDGRIIAAVDLLAYGGGSNMPSGAISHPRLATSSSLPKSSFNSPALSLALQTSGEGLTGMPPPPPVSSGGSGGATRRSREEDLNEISRSGSGDMDGAPSGDDLDGCGADFPPRKKRYHRHTPQQIQELEALFKECPHPDEKQRLELSQRLSLETRQVKFWFQNRRTQMKTQLERHENSSLRQDNEKLRAENMSIRDAMRSPICTNCGGPALIGDFSLEEQHLRIENARLKDELDRVCNLAGKFLGHRPVPSSSAAMLPLSSGLELGVGAFTAALPMGPGDFVPSCRPTGSAADCNGVVNGVNVATGRGGAGMDRSVLLEVALGAMEELLRMAQGDDSLWVRSMDGGREVLNREEYTSSTAAAHSFSFTGLKPSQASEGFASEASRESGMVIINSLALVETLMDSNRWAEMFPCMIGRTSTEDVISRGVGGTRDGALQLMHAELQLLSPLVPVRGVTFLRFCKQQAEGVWAVVDVSVDIVRQGSGSPMYVNCRRFPSGCVVQDMPNGYSKVTWVEHAEYDETAVHHLYRPMVGAGMGFGAQRWVATLQRQCQCLAILMSSSLPSPDHSNAITASGRRSMLKLAQRMTDNFCTGVCASSVHKWNKLCTSHVDEDVRVMTRKSVDDPGEPPGVVLSAATSVWLPISPHRLFDFLRDERLRSQWDILSNGGPMQEMAHIAKGQDHGNCVSLLRATAMNANQSSMLILQETCIDASGSLVVYAPVDIPAMHVVMNGGDSACVALLPSGFAIAPDGPGSLAGPTEPKPNAPPGPLSSGVSSSSGSLLTVAFQILVNSLPTAKLTVESVETVNNLISCTVQKIKAALHCES